MKKNAIAILLLILCCFVVVTISSCGKQRIPVEFVKAAENEEEVLSFDEWLKENSFLEKQVRAHVWTKVASWEEVKRRTMNWWYEIYLSGRDEPK